MNEVHYVNNLDKAMINCIGILLELQNDGCAVFISSPNVILDRCNPFPLYKLIKPNVTTLESYYPNKPLCLSNRSQYSNRTIQTMTSLKPDTVLQPDNPNKPLRL